MAIMYNYYPAILLGGIVAKAFGVKLVLDVEDVCEPRLADWLGHGDARPVQQLGGWGLLKIGLALCDAVMVPSRRFLDTAGITKRHLVVTGCVDVDPEAVAVEKGPGEAINVLVSGKLDDEQGVALVLDTIERLRAELPRRLEFHFAGFLDSDSAIAHRLGELATKRADVTFHGTLTTSEFQSLLRTCDVCIAMQKPMGRHRAAKTPSKVYEYLAAGKVVIATDVGDLGELPSDVIALCDYDAQRLAGMLETLASDWGRWWPRGHAARKHSAQEFMLKSVGERIVRELAKEQR